MWITRDDYGLVQLWNDEPEEYKDSIGYTFFGSHDEVGVEVNNIESLRSLTTIHNKLEIYANIK